jgi:hypothetical protein
MPTVTIPRADLTTDEVVAVLRDGLGTGYNVLPGMTIGQTALEGPQHGRPNTIVVGTGRNRVVKAQVTIISKAGRTQLRISPGGITWDRLLNTFGIARKVHRVLASSANLSAR